MHGRNISISVPCLKPWPQGLFAGVSVSKSWIITQSLETKPKSLQASCLIVRVVLDGTGKMRKGAEFSTWALCLSLAKKSCCYDYSPFPRLLVGCRRTEFQEKCYPFKSQIKKISNQLCFWIQILIFGEPNTYLSFWGAKYFWKTWFFVTPRSFNSDAVAGGNSSVVGAFTCISSTIGAGAEGTVCAMHHSS